jgi:Ca2+-binding RTX toxin-like protein
MNRAAALLAAAVCLLVPATAQGASVFRSAGSDTVLFEAALGEANRVAISEEPGFVVFADTGAPLTAGTGCSGPDGAGAVRCASAAIAEVQVYAADLDDVVVNDSGFASRLDGGAGADRLTGGAAVDRIHAGAGADEADGRGGNDELHGEDPTAPGDAGADRLAGGPGADVLEGGPLADTLDGGDGDDTLRGGPGNDVLGGAAGNDTLTGGDDNDTLQGGDGDDIVGLVAAAGLGGPPEPGSDVVDGGAGDDTLSPGSGPDLTSADQDTLIGGPGADAVSYGARTTRVELSKNSAADDGAAGEGDNISDDVERVAGGPGRDLLIGGPGPDVLDGAGDGDTIEGRGGPDELIGGADAGEDVVAGEEGADVIVAGDGDDEVTGGAGDDVVDGGGSADRIAGDGGDDLLDGRGGNDDFVGGGGADQFRGGPGTDSVAYAETTRVRVSLDETARDGAGDGAEGDNVHRDVERVLGGSQEDTFTGDEQANELQGGAGEDYLRGEAGADVLQAGSRNDVLAARDGSRDVVRCGVGRDDFAIADRRDDVARSGREGCEHVDLGNRDAAAGRSLEVVPRSCAGGELGLQLPAMARTVPLEDTVVVPLRSSVDAEECKATLRLDGRARPATDVSIEGSEVRVTQRRNHRAAVELRLHEATCPGSFHARVARHRRPPYATLLRLARAARGARSRKATAAAVAAITPTSIRVGSVRISADRAATLAIVEDCDSTRVRVRRGAVTLRSGTGRPVRLRAGRARTIPKR